MIKTVLVPVDGSPAAEAVLPYMELIASRTGAALHLVIAILTPGLLLGFLASPWFFLIMFLLLLLFPMVLAPKPDNRDSLKSSSGQESPGLLVWILVIAAIVFAVQILLLGFLLAPGFFLIILLVTAPLIWMAFRPSS